MEKVKTKVRFTSLDVAAMVQNLKRLIGMRATNIYDINPSTYVLKMAKTQEKALLLIENGVRFHTIEEKQSKTIPSGFTMRFRKYLRSKRLEDIRQVGVERVVVLTFGSEALCNHLILQLYSQGNIILTDNNYKILQCIRSHQFNDKVKTAVGQIYPFQYAAHIYFQNITISRPKVEQTLQKLTQKQQEQQQEQQDATNKKKKKKQKKQSNNKANKLRDIVFKLIPCLFPAVIENILLENNIDSEAIVCQENIEIIQEGSKVCYKFLKQFLKSEHLGYLYSKTQMPQKEEDMEYFEYSSYKNIKFTKNNVEFKHQSFDMAVRQYHSKFNNSKHNEEQQFEELAWRKFQQIKKDQEMRVKKLQEEQDIFKLKAEYIEKNIDDVQAIIKIMRTMEEEGYSWDDMKRMVSESKKKGDPLANMIYELNILKRNVSVLLGDPTDQNQYSELLPVEINIDYNAYTNATIYYSSKKKNYQKQLRTKQASQQVLKIAQKDALKVIDKKKNEQFQKNMPTRKLFWFERFYWFISSEGVLIISGRDSHQNQLLVKRYMKPGDLYMHSDYGGAASTVIKINSRNIQPPRTTLQEAAIFTVCRSKAWDTKILSGAWWVYHDQVSKSAPTGQFLPTGSFMIRGKRNFVYPNRMQMGITFLFKVDQQSAKRHMDDRKIHQDLQKKELQQNQIALMKEQNKDSQEFAIISLDTTKTKGPKGKNNKNQAKTTNNKQTQVKKEQNLKNNKQNSQQNSQDEGSSQQSQDSNEKYNKYNKKQGNTSKQPQKNKAQQQQQQLQQVPKQKMRNKRKQQKLEKYLQEQDEEERQIIMKMIGAREMKHMRVQEEKEIQIQSKKIDKKKKNKGKKKGLEKYIGSQDSQQFEEKLNPDKVLFLKKKGQQESSSELQEEVEVKQEVKNENQNSQQLEEKKQEGEKEGQEEQQEQNQSQSQQQQQKDENNNVQQQQKAETTQQKKSPQQQEIDEKVVDSEIAQLFKLVGKIQHEDTVQNLVTMCAPYNSIKQNRFKIKLVPGGLKKGKASRNIMHYFMNAVDLVQQEKPMLRSVPEQEIINALLGNVKLAGAGLLKMEQKNKAQKKQKKKQSEKREKGN